MGVSKLVKWEASASTEVGWVYTSALAGAMLLEY